jgi:PAS domain S-box-containing protein
VQNVRTRRSSAFTTWLNALDPQRQWSGYALALGVTLIAAFCNWLVTSETGGYGPLMTYMLAVMVAAWYGSAGAGLMSLLLSIVATVLLSIGVPGAAESFSAYGFFALGLLIAAGVAAIFALTRMRIARDRERAANEAYKATQARLDRALEAGRLVSWEWELSSGRVQCSASALKVFGADLDHIDEVWKFIHPDDAACVRATVEKALAGENEYSTSNRMIRTDTGALQWLETRALVHRSGNGKPLHVTGFTSDITEKQQALETLKATEQRFRVALEGSSITAWACDADRRYIWVHNPAADYKTEDFIGRRIGTIGEAGEEYAEYAAALDRVWSTGQPARLPVRWRHAGRTRHFLSNIDPVRDASGRVVGLVGASVDVTALQEAEQSLRDADRRKDEFLATLAHELRNPLAPIRYAAKLLSPDAPPATQAKASEIIERQATQMARLLDDLLDMSRVTRNVIELRREVFDLRRVVEDAVAGAKPLIEGLHHGLQVTLAGEPLWVNADITRVRQILDNLLQNAAKYTDPGGHIEIHASLELRSAVLVVRDTGIGLAPETLRRVFDLFTQVQPAGRGRTGLGIGLAVVKRLVELHGGEIDVHSAGPGKGARFTVRLPLCESLQRDDTEDPAKVVRLFNAEARVLVVDDNTDVVDSLSLLLRNQGIPVHTATDGEAAIRLADVLQPEVVLLDLGMPKIDGYQVAAWIRRQSWGAGVRIIAITGWGQGTDREHTRSAGFDAHLVKPVDSDELLHLIHADRGRVASIHHSA